MSLMKIRLELGRTQDNPQGDPRHGYEFVAPLDARGYLDPVEWKAQKDSCAVRRFHPHEAEYRGSLRHNGRGWLFDYLPGRSSDNEVVFRLDRHRIEKGLYLTVTEEDGVARPFKIVDVRPLPETVPARSAIAGEKRHSHQL
jgi:hypothetical protein